MFYSEIVISVNIGFPNKKNIYTLLTCFYRTSNYWNYGHEKRSSNVSYGKKHIDFDWPFQIRLSPT